MPYEYKVFDFNIDENNYVDISTYGDQGFYTLDSYLDQMENLGYKLVSSEFIKEHSFDRDGDKLFVIVHKEFGNDG